MKKNKKGKNYKSNIFILSESAFYKCGFQNKESKKRQKKV